MGRAVYLFALSAACCWAAKKPVTIDTVIAGQTGSAGRVTPNIYWARDGSKFIFNENGALRLCDVKSGREREVVAMSKLEAAAVKGPPAAVFDWTNRRVGESNIQWFADGKRLLVAAAGDLFVVNTEKGSFEALTQTAEAERDPKLSPDNQYVSFRRGPDLYALEIDAKRVTRLTSNGSETLLNGQLDWVYPEELELGTAHWWSPDSRWIAYLQFDIGAGADLSAGVAAEFARDSRTGAYPKAGDPNAEVRLGIVSPDGRRDPLDGHWGIRADRCWPA